VPPSDSAYGRARFYLAQAHMALGQTPEALAVLEALVTLPPDEILLHETEWYLALGYLDMGKLDAARKLLQGLIALPGPNGRKSAAAEILRALE
jgi:tetratricopeptide (TPR) repeat protein